MRALRQASSIWPQILALFCLAAAIVYAADAPCLVNNFGYKTKKSAPATAPAE
jgi:hypothetical protein